MGLEQGSELPGSAFEILGMSVCVASFILFHYLQSLRYQGPCWLHLLVSTHEGSFPYMIC